MKTSRFEDDIIPIALRKDLTVRIQGLPRDMTKDEAQKVANVILALGRLAETNGEN